MFVQTKTDLEKLRNLIKTRNVSVQEISYTRNGYRVLFKELKPYEKEVMGESFNEFAARAFPRIVNKNPAQSFSDFREFLSETLIPDLRDSGMDSTADDFESAVNYLTYGKDKNYPKWKTFITKTLVPDLRESGYKETAKDFMTAVKFIDAGRRVVRKNAFSSESDRIKGYDDDRDDVPDKPLFKSGGYAVVITFKSGEVEIGQGISKDQAERQRKYLMKQYARLKLTRGINNVSSIEVLPVTSVTKNPPLSSHGSSIRIKRTHGLSLAEMRALYKLVKQGKDIAIEYARKKLEVPRSASKSDLLAVVDHHIRDLADR